MVWMYLHDLYVCMYRMINGRFQVRTFLLFKRTMTTFYLTPYNSWSLYYFKFKKYFLNFKTRLFISTTSFWHKSLSYYRQYYRSLHPLLLNTLYYLSILNSKSHIWSKVLLNPTKNYLFISKKYFSQFTIRSLQTRNHILGWKKNLLEPMQIFLN